MTKIESMLGTVARIRKRLKGDILSLMVYGSVARGTALKASDFDLLQLSSHPRRPYQIDNVNVSVYTPEFLSRMAIRGSLFVLHLKHDGVLVEDSEGLLSKCIETYQKPSDYSPLRSDLRIATELLGVTENDYLKNWISYGRISLFILRTTLYAASAEDLPPVFSISEIARQKQDPRIEKAYNAKYLSKPDWSLFQLKISLIEEYLACTISKTCTPEELMLKHQNNELVVSLVYRLIGKSKPIDFYFAVRDHIRSLRAPKQAMPSDLTLKDMFD